MKTITIDQSNVGAWITPPEHQGQIVVVSFARAWDCRHDGEIVLRRTHDQSDGTKRIEAFEWSARGGFEPWARVPPLGRRIGRAVIEEVAS